MRAPAILLGLFALGACASLTPPDHSFPVFFTDNSSTLDAPGQAIVARAAVVAKRFDTLPVVVYGYADTNGTPEEIAKMSKDRADAVAAMLIADGVFPSSITRKPSGIAPNSQPGVVNRRAEIDIGG